MPSAVVVRRQPEFCAPSSSSRDKSQASMLGLWHCENTQEPVDI